MKTIVVATDFSPNADNALQYAGALAATTEAKIILFNAYKVPVHASNTLLSAASVDELFNAHKERLEKIAVKTANAFGIKVEAQTTMALVTEALEELVLTELADLVVMGSHDNDWGDRLFGNTTTAVIRVAKYPVLVVPSTATFNGIDKILYAFDANCLKMGNKLNVLKDIARSFRAEVQVFHVDTTSKQAVGTSREFVDSNVEAALTDVGHSYKEVEEKNIVEGIEKGLKEFGANLLVMVPHKLKFWESVINLSITRSIVLRTRVPLLVVPNTTIASN